MILPFGIMIDTCSDIHHTEHFIPSIQSLNIIYQKFTSSEVNNKPQHNLYNNCLITQIYASMQIDCICLARFRCLFSVIIKYGFISTLKLPKNLTNKVSKLLLLLLSKYRDIDNF